MFKLRRLTYWLSRVIKSIISLIVYNFEEFMEHYHGPDYQAAIDDYFEYLKWEYKADRMIDPHDAREKLAEFLYDRGAMLD
jgi:hypothetical protein